MRWEERSSSVNGFVHFTGMKKRLLGVSGEEERARCITLSSIVVCDGWLL